MVSPLLPNPAAPTSASPTPTTTIVAEEEVESNSINSKVEKDDIEHMECLNDPRLWSSTTKNLILATIAFTAMSGTISTNIFFPAIASLQEDLNTTSTKVAASISIYIFVQGGTPMLWSALSEIKGRKLPYVLSLIIYCASTIGCALSNSITSFIFARIFQALGSAAVLALGAGTLADIYESRERGTKLGIYYLAPLLGPSVGPIIGGLLTKGGSWRLTFYFLLGYGLICLSLMVWLPDTFREQRSLAWQKAYRSALAHAKLEKEKILVEGINGVEKGVIVVEEGKKEGGRLGRIISSGSGREKKEEKLKIRFSDVNPFAAIGLILSKRHNLIATLVSGLLFACQYSIAYTVSISFAAPPYNFDSIFIGLVLLSFGVGNLIGSLAGGKYSDIILKKLKGENGGIGQAEFRIRSTKLGMYFLPTSLLVYAWVVQTHQNIALPLISLFVLGVATIWIYTSTLAYIVDANPGRSSTAVATNSLARGTLAAIASQISEPLVNLIGQGWFYTGFAVVLTIGCGFLLLVAEKGQKWREDDLLKEQEAEKEAERKLLS